VNSRCRGGDDGATDAGGLLSEISSTLGSSAIVADSIGDLSRPRRAWVWEELDPRERTERTDADAWSCDAVEDVGCVTLIMLTTESRGEYNEPADDARESLEARLERAADINMRVSCSVIGEGPGTGGRGVEGGKDIGGLGLGRGLEPDRAARGVGSGVVGMCDGGAGKDEMSNGMACLRLLESVVVEVEVAMAQRRRAKGEEPKEDFSLRVCLLLYCPREVSGNESVRVDCYGRVAGGRHGIWALGII
jgi:hypothetical protein